MRKVLFAIAALALSFGAFADPKVKGETYVGMKVTAATAVCTKPHLIKDLIEVINDEGMYFTYFRGYDLSGYCGAVDFKGSDAYMELKYKFPFTNKSWDGYRAEMWIVLMPEVKGVREIRYAIILPDAVENIGGAGI